MLVTDLVSVYVSVSVKLVPLGALFVAVANVLELSVPGFTGVPPDENVNPGLL